MGSFRGSPFLILRIKKNDLACSLLPARCNLCMGSNLWLHSRMSKKILFWLGVCIVSLLVMVRPASAMVGVKGAIFPDCYSTWSEIPVNVEITINGYRYKNTSCNSVSCSIQVFSPPGYTGWVNNVPSTINHSACTLAAACPVADTTAGSYWINTGTVPSSIYTVGVGTLCKAGCETKHVLAIEIISNSTSTATQADGAWKLVNGVRQYYSYRNYYYTGQTCSGGDTQAVASAVPSADSCAAGQSTIQMGTKIACIDPSTGAKVNPNSASSVAAAQTLTAAKAAAQILAAQQAAQAAGLSASSVDASKTVAAGVGAAGSIGGTTSTGFAPDDPMHAFCVDNPQASICKDQTKTTVSTAALSGLYTAGTLNNSKTFGSVVGDFKTRFLASGIGAGAGGFFNVTATAGACPTWSSDVPMFGVMTFDFYCGSTFQNLLPWMRAVILIIFSVVAFRIGFL